MTTVDHATAPLHRIGLPTPVGTLHLIASGRGLRAVLWPDDRAGRVPLPASITDSAEHPVLAAAGEQLTDWFEGGRRHFDLPLDPVGSTFQHAVWDVLAGIGYGRTSTYADVAERIGDRGKARAVGAAIGRNPLSIVVPCHRVVGTGGKLTGFAGGLEIKRRLLDHESGATLPLDPG